MIFLKAETYQPASTNSTHGKSGPIKVSLAEQPMNICEDFLSVAEKFDKDRGSLDDTNGFFSCDGYGVRMSHPAVSFYIYNLLTNFTYSYSSRNGQGE